MNTVLRLILVRRRHFLSCSSFALLLACSTQAQTQVLELNVQVYRYSFAAAPGLSSTLSQSDIEALLNEVNRIWVGMNIRWNLLPVVDRKVGEKDFPQLAGNEERVEIKKRLLAVSPSSDVKGRIWKVVIIREFPVPAGGLYLPETKTVYFAEMTRGGKTSPVILAHELGHSLGLPHDYQASNLMHRAAGARNNTQAYATTLTPDQIATARAQAQKGPTGGVYGATGDSDEGLGTPQGNSGNSVSNQVRRGSNTDRQRRMAERFRTFDRDGDGVVRLEDVPEAARAVFHRIDTNRDGSLDEKELNNFHG